MKKRSLVVGLALVMAASMSLLTGCGSSKEDYINDLNEMVDNASSPSDMDMKTSEGKQLKKDLEDMLDNPDDATDLLSDYMEHITEFGEAAEDAGVSEDDLASLTGLN